MTPPHDRQLACPLHPDDPGFVGLMGKYMPVRYRCRRSTCKGPYTAMSLSDGSVSSTRSLRSQGLVESVPTSGRTRKVPAHWTQDEEATLLQYLLSHKAEAGDTASFQKTTWQGAADHINAAFPNQRGGEKTIGVCKTKWTNVSMITIICIHWPLSLHSDSLRLLIMLLST